MKLSIITTVYNAEADIRETVESVLNQGIIDLEYIVTDGGSTDKTLNILDDYPEVTVFSESDKGIYDGMNKGISKASGDLIGILNAADRYASGALSSVIEAAVSNTDAGVFHGRMNWIKDGAFAMEVGSPVSERKGMHRMPVCHPTTFIRRSVYEEFGLFDDSYKIAADHKLLRNLLANNVGFYFIDQVIAEMEGGGASAVHRKVKRDEVLRTLSGLNAPLSDKAHVWYSYFLLVARDVAVSRGFAFDAFKPLFRKLKVLKK